ncbi:uncharacterized protein GGS22DRAFT_193719 [Annulohypoxylon maeteangense]|uniref:uncharacterized protein n=1 Tax=Annulohypoxylon maeteangense TaxID=1927788 RepID=UPI002008BBBE|nr:uncharacterized protein GGS22DRAFT_193719 [Annulohypoxylon maeteangense]KAI0880025.1 hypothetical protein GGS22DRAFT_193719 [Annulohypoxylon maeteangense]
MEPSVATELHHIWSMEKDRMIVKHKSDLALQDELLEKLEQELHQTHNDNIQKLKVIVPLTSYRDIILPMAEKSLKYDRQEVEASHNNRVRIIEDKHVKALAEHEVLYQDKLKAALVNENQSSMKTSPSSISWKSSDDQSDHGSLLKDANVILDESKGHQRPTLGTNSASPNPKQPFGLCRPLSWNIQNKVIRGERRLIMHVQSRKRSAPASDELHPKRLRVDTSVNQIYTPAPTPSSESTNSPPKRTITFDEVYQGGNANHKDTIVEWPTGSRQWYILKCEQHGLRFTKNSVQGAARHLNGNGHGCTDRNRDHAVRTLGYLVTDCNEDLAKLNNRVAEETYVKGHKQPFHRLKKQRTSGITHPKDFHIYYGRWKDGGLGKVADQIYPVMILGWDSQNGSGLKDGDLNATGLLKKKAKPPNCYTYDSRRITGWAPGYEDGGSKVRLRRFPVMFFDEAQTVGWFPARDLMKFPLNWRDVPGQPDHPFNAARRWIAEREGYKTWEDREEARIGEYAPSTSPLTPAKSANTVSHTEDIHDSNSSYSESEATSVDSSATEKMMQNWREKGGEITGDEDYAVSDSDSDVDDSLDCEIEDWIQSSPSVAKPENSTNRPWAFYGLRGAVNTDKPKPSVVLAREAPDSPAAAAAASAAADICPARKLAEQACPSTTKSQDPYIAPISTITPPSKFSAQAMQDPDQSGMPRQYYRQPSDNESIRNHNLAEIIAEALKFRNGVHNVSTAPENQGSISQTIEYESLGTTTSGSMKDTLVPPSSTNATTSPRGQMCEKMSPRLTSKLAAEVSEMSSLTNLLGSKLIHDDNNHSKGNIYDTSSSNHTTLNSVKSTINAGGSSIRAENRDTGNKQPLNVERGAISQMKETVQCSQEGASDAKQYGQDTLPHVDTKSSSIQPLVDVENATPAMGPGLVGDAAMVGLHSAAADFELSFYRSCDMSWERTKDQGDCVQLFYSADRRTVSTRQGPVSITIDPMEMMGFSREKDIIPDSKGNTVFVLRHGNGSSSRLVFDRSGGSKLGNGKLQARGFIKWLRTVKPDIAFL